MILKLIDLLLIQKRRAESQLDQEKQKNVILEIEISELKEKLYKYVFLYKSILLFFI